MQMNVIFKNGVLFTNKVNTELKVGKFYKLFDLIWYMR